MNSYFFVLVLVALVANVAAKLKGKSQNERSGMLLIDSVTFPRIVPNANRSVVVFVWPEVEQDYGVDSLREDYYSFVESAEYVGNSDNILFTQMAIDLDLKRNNELAFSWDPSMAEKANPRVFFFPKGSSECHPYYRRGQINGISLAQWLGKKTIFYMGVSGTVQAFYLLAREFVIDSKTDMERLNVIEKTRETVQQFIEDHESKGSSMADHPDFVDMAHYYIKTMERMIDLEKNPKGEYVYDELLRLEELVSGESSQLSNEKRMELQKRMNILDNFIVIEEWDAYIQVLAKQRAADRKAAAEEKAAAEPKADIEL